jgi:hypothetical protein
MFESLNNKIPLRLLIITILLFTINAGGGSLAKFLGRFSTTPHGKALYDTLLDFNGDNDYSKELLIELLKASDFTDAQIDSALMGGINSMQYNFEYIDQDKKSTFIEVKFTALTDINTGQFFYSPTIRDHYGNDLKDDIDKILLDLKPENIRYTGYSIENIEEIGKCILTTKQNANNVGTFFTQQNLAVPSQKPGTYTQISGKLESVQANVTVLKKEPSPGFNQELFNCKEQ